MTAAWPSLPFAEWHDTCATLRDQYDKNERALSRAFKSDQPPLLQREKELLAQLSHC